MEKTYEKYEFLEVEITINVTKMKTKTIFAK